MPLVSGKFTEDQLLLTSNSWLVSHLPLYGIGMYLQKVCSAMRRMTLYAVSVTLPVLSCRFWCCWWALLAGMIFVAATSAIFYVVSDTIMLISCVTPWSDWTASMVFAFVRSILWPRRVSCGTSDMVGLRAVIGAPNGRALYGVLYCIFAGIPAVLVTCGNVQITRVHRASCTGFSRKRS